MFGIVRMLMNALDPLYNEPSTVKKAFEEWDRPSRTLQIRAIAVLTGLLYIVFSQIDHALLPSYALEFATLIHLYFLPPMLFLISAMTFSKRLYRSSVVLLTIAPVLANLGNLYLYGMLYPTSLYLAEIYTPEIYLSIMWMFAISGLRLSYAMISASLTVAAHLAHQLYLAIPVELLSIHLLWITAAVSFGILSAVILDRTNKRIFLNARELENMATIDKLSGLCNRMKIESFCIAEIERAKRYGEVFSIILLDIDYFKSINDTFGHNAGDKVIQQISLIMTDSVRSVDRVGRWGGEEFLILLPQTTGEQAYSVAEHIRERIAQSDFSPVSEVRISAGITAYRNGDTVDKMVQRADEGLYDAKEGGRNKTCKI